jgi:hypothetical protein
LLLYQGPERRSGADRRLALSSARPWTTGGWLVFESEGEKRRLMAIPTDWDMLSDADLEQLFRAARRVRKVATPDVPAPGEVVRPPDHAGGRRTS